MAFDREQTRRAQGAVVIAALVMAVILLVIVLSGAFKASPGAAAGSTSSASASTSSTSASAASSSAASTGTSSSNSGLSSMADVDTMYGNAEKQLQTKYDADPTNPSALLNLANGYFDWGYAAMSFAESDDEESHVRDLFQKAVDSYDSYLEANPSSKSVEVDRAIAIYYGGDAMRAIQTLEDFTQDDATFGPAWANLGMFYEGAGRTDDAKAAYRKAVETDPDDTYQVKTYAQQRLDALG